MVTNFSWERKLCKKQLLNGSIVAINYFRQVKGSDLFRCRSGGWIPVLHRHFYVQGCVAAWLFRFTWHNTSNQISPFSFFLQEYLAHINPQESPDPESVYWKPAGLWQIIQTWASAVLANKQLKHWRLGHYRYPFKIKQWLYIYTHIHIFIHTHISAPAHGQATESNTLQLRSSALQKRIRWLSSPDIQSKKPWTIMTTLANAREHISTLNNFR